MGTTTPKAAPDSSLAEPHLRVSSYTDIIGPSTPSAGTVADGGRLTIGSVPGCWGPMITPQLHSTHEVSLPVNVAGAEVGDGLALHIERVRLLSRATSSGVDDGGTAGRFEGDPGVVRKCPSCGAKWPETRIEGIGQDAVRCIACGAPAAPFHMTHGYTIVFDGLGTVGLTVDRDAAVQIAREARAYSGLDRYPNSRSHSVLVLAKSDLAGVLARLRPFVGNLGTTPARDLPSSRNAGDVGMRLVDADHQYGLSIHDFMSAKTDGHMDIDSVREGAIVIAPVKVAGGGVYCGDAHAMQGDGELAGHTTDVVAEVELQVDVVKGLGADGPILLPPEEDLPFIARPYREEEITRARALAKELGVGFVEEVAPVQFIGTGANLNEATANGIERTAHFLGESPESARNRATITGCVEVGRLPGVVTITVLVPFGLLEQKGLGHLVARQYSLPFLRS